MSNGRGGEKSANVRAVHIHDAAHVGGNLVAMAREMGQHWSMTGLPWYYRRSWGPLMKHPASFLRPVVWDSTLALRSLHADVLHLHTGGLSEHMRWVRRPWVLHLHGTDVRTRQYDGWGPRLRYGTSRAAAVLYSTPDLAPHVANLTDRGQYFPGPIRLDQAPPWQPRAGRVVFASRWDDIKGASAQLDVARRLREARPGIELVGLDWGERASLARSAGITLLPKMQSRDFRSWLATGSVAVGQMTDILAISELEALAIGVPLVSSARHDFYPRLGQLCDPSAESVAAAALRALDSPQQASLVQAGRDFIAAEHDAPVAVRRLTAIYQSVLRGRQPGLQRPHH
jgi:glycosyltransferase involved in cell wall biosynthesis